ncbi:MAG: hypothetical protein ACD_35C00034G0001 [uncultured bacterium]|nr:MAG: hypothetical protein ACD_35C00034G0001 [uncultured bacterium]
MAIDISIHVLGKAMINRQKPIIIEIGDEHKSHCLAGRSPGKTVLYNLP